MMYKRKTKPIICDIYSFVKNPDTKTRWECFKSTRGSLILEAQRKTQSQKRTKAIPPFAKGDLIARLSTGYIFRKGKRIPTGRLSFSNEHFTNLYSISEGALYGDAPNTDDAIVILYERGYIMHVFVLPNKKSYGRLMAYSLWYGKAKELLAEKKELFQIEANVWERFFSPNKIYDV